MASAGELRLIVGLGNPSRSYAGTRHNIGAAFIQFLEKAHSVSSEKTRQADLSRLAGFFNLDLSDSLILARPRCYMNESGGPVQGLMAKYKILPSQILVVVDDFMIPFGTARLRQKGSSGGHNGLKSIMECLGTETFGRLRLGVGPVPSGEDPADFVLDRFSRKEGGAMDDLFKSVAIGISTLLSDGWEKAMNQINKSHVSIE